MPPQNNGRNNPNPPKTEKNPPAQSQSFQTLQDPQQPQPVIDPTFNQPSSSPSSILSDSLPPISTSLSSPPVATPPANQPPLSPQMLKKGGKILLASILFFIIIIFSVVGGAIALAYNNYAFYKPPELISDAIDNFIVAAPLPKPTRIIINSTIAKSVTLKSADLNSEFLISTTSTNSPISSFKLGVSGPVDFENTNSRAAEADVSLEAKFEGASFSGSASLKTVDKTLYFKINEFPFGSLYQQLVPYKNKWFFYKIPDQYYPDQTQLMNNTQLKEVFTTFIKKSQDWTKTSAQSNGDYLLEVNPPKSEIDQFLLDLANIYMKQSKMDPKVADSVNLQEISKFTQKLSNLKITAIANKDNFYLKKAEITFDISMDNFSLPSAGQETLMPATNNIIYNTKITVELSNYNKQIVIVPPENSEDFQKLLDDFSKNPYNSMNLNKGNSNDAKDANIKNDISSIATALQANFTLKASQGAPTYVKDLKELEPDYLKSVPTPPVETGITSYQYKKDPQSCDETAQNPCKEVAVYAPLTQPKTPGNVWCWQSITGKVQELSPSECLANKAPAEKTGNGIQIDQLLAPKSPVLGSKSSWDLEVIKLFQSFFK